MKLGASYQYQDVPQFKYAQPTDLQAHFTSHPAGGGQQHADHHATAEGGHYAQQHAAAPHPDWYGSYLAQTGHQDPYSAPHPPATHFGHQAAAPDPHLVAVQNALVKIENYYSKELGKFKVGLPKWNSHNPSDPTVGASASSSGAPAKATSKVPGQKPTAPAPKLPAPKPASQKPSSTKKCKKCRREGTKTKLEVHNKKHPTYN
ncbi:hypothetical protein C8A01DRAFT_42231 [Parachaetomium inaequale]|uniref:Uncharacterized protein n=1 Tax=Parachaetomium inaequale TaxID=2588326 RepID=A0AAN6SK39_9PEZI|nr:hypothetical protein C8A01DRAFT_42231 [Parachaetomium inaequale]